MNLAELTDQEAKTIYLIHSKVNYHDSKQLKGICETLRQKKLLRSEPAREFENCLNLCELDPDTADQECIFCAQVLRNEERHICTTCFGQIEQRLKIVTVENRSKADTDGKNTVQVGTAAEEATDATSEKPVDSSSRRRIWIIIAASVALITFLAAGIHFVFNQKLQQITAREHAEAEKVTSMTQPLELIGLLGAPYEQAEILLGKSEAVVTENTRYFPEACISAIYDEESSSIIYIDCDGKGASSYTICGIPYGAARQDVTDALWEMGFEQPFQESEDTQNYRFIKDSIGYELSITFTEDHVGLICCGRIAD